ncbi:flp pilus assembly protein TadD [Candidatus Vecturithrix granuli]|uniref:Flp pilus assembly protein TadD n=1 Tax=Vecturithrix granuli TaxID=1499967 RepID=A0A081C173_VECG1|nr:flp pilus assembly protein TadD [Candidatus Vecturithrix granuli]
MMKRTFLTTLWIWLLLSMPVLAMEQRWIDDLNQRFPGIGYEFREAVQQKLAQHGGDLSAEELIEKLLASPEYAPDAITNARTFGLHSELMLLYPALGKYQDALREAKLLRDFVMQYSAEDLKVLQTFRGVYAELLIINEEYEQALQEIEAVIALNPEEEGNYLGRGVIAVKLGQFEQAMQDLAILIQTPEAEQHAQELFVFLMQHRQKFQKARVQPNTMIDVMLKELEPESAPHIRIPSQLETANTSPSSPEQPDQQTTARAETTDQDSPAEPFLKNESEPLTSLTRLNAEQIAQRLGTPLAENESEQTIDRDYTYQDQTLTISFDKEKHQILSFQMFFLPLVDETTAFARMGVLRRDLPPTIATDMLKVWNTYGPFSKVRLSLNEGQVIAMIVEP